MGSTARDAVRSRAQQARGGGEPEAPTRGIIDILNSEATKEQLRAALPPGLSLERFLRTTRTAIQLDPNLAACDVKSTIAAVHKAASLGLEPNVGQQCYLQPFNKKCTFVMGYRGMIALARRSGLIAELYARPVYRNERFNVEYGLDERLEHSPIVDAGAQKYDDETGEALVDEKGKAVTVDRGPLRCLYGVAKFRGHDGSPAGHYWIVVPLQTIYEHRERSSGWRAYNSGNIRETPWHSDFEAMALKTVVRIMEPHLPLTPEVARAFQEDESWQPDVGREEHRTDGDVIDTGLADPGEPGPEDVPPPGDGEGEGTGEGEPPTDEGGADGNGDPAPDPTSPENINQDPEDPDATTSGQEAPGEATTEAKPTEPAAADEPGQGQLVAGGEDQPPPKKASAPKKAAAKKQAAQQRVAPPRNGDKIQPVSADGFCPECELIKEHSDECPNNPKNRGRNPR